MTQTRILVLVVFLALGGAMYGVATSQTAGRGGVAAKDQRARTQRASCPKDVLASESRRTPIAVVIRAAQRRLARQTLNSQGTIYHLTSRNAPIDYVQQLGLDRGYYDQNVPGLVGLHRAAAAACGERIAQASWAIHYELPVAQIVGAAGYPFFVKTRAGWRFWGGWCGARKSRSWRTMYCR